MVASNFVRLATGAKMPLIGLGTLHSTADELKRAVLAAIDIGYRHIDTAKVYFNEKAIGEALQIAFQSGKVKRSEMFITTKLHVQFAQRRRFTSIARAIKSFAIGLRRLVLNPCSRWSSEKR